ncbi:DUF1737 domain-containing protein [Lactococcus taiwanensis]|uniref:DUF1737 domain-containing protein n=1 Tax=Lactococcus taiwanensis TaxID=1151742 RepID=UPI0028A9DDB8|nr:DUF1737 domain-containing protein [Lactococcus taiwanensis]
MKYMVMRCDSNVKLINEIERYLKLGWKLQGGVSIISHGMSIYCSQAMVKD